MTNEMLILVDQNDHQIGLMEKMETHEKGVLHRAFSVFILNSKGEILLQQRALGKYHSPGLWSNTCCSHPMAGESTIDAAHRRLFEEMGMKAELVPVYQFLYKAEFENGLTEHEYDHVFIGISDDEPNLNPYEVADWKCISIEALSMDLKSNPELYSVWLSACFDEVRTKILSSNLLNH